MSRDLASLLITYSPNDKLLTLSSEDSDEEENGDVEVPTVLL